MIKLIKEYFSLLSDVRQLEKDVENLENRLLAPESATPATYLLSSAWMSYVWGDNKDRKITLEEKVDALAKVLGVRFEMTPEQDSEVIAKIVKKSK